MTRLFDRLKAAAGPVWTAYTHHPFIAALADGSLPAPAFRHYLEQDYLFLIHFARAYALAVYKSEHLDEMRAAAASVANILDREMALHVAYCRQWGLDEAGMAARPEDPACLAYTRFVLERGMAGDLLDLQVALAPCVVGYAEIAARLAADPATRREGNPYSAWIAAYADPDYQAVAEGAIAALDRLTERRGGLNRLAGLERDFTAATRLEVGFWQMGLDAATPR